MVFYTCAVCITLKSEQIWYAMIPCNELIPLEVRHHKNLGPQPIRIRKFPPFSSLKAIPNQFHLILNHLNLSNFEK